MTNAATSSLLEAPLLLEDEEDERQRQQPLAPPPPLPRPKRGSSSSCFLADGIHDDGIGETDERGRNGAAAAATSASVSTAAARRELARAAHAKTQRRLAAAAALAAAFMVAEVVGGALANSLAIMSDAAHLLSDVAGMGIALAAGAASARRALPGSAHTYGHHRAEVLGALASTAATWAATAALTVAAVGRLRRPEHVDGKLMFIMAVGGVFVNVLLLFVLGGAHGHGSGGGGHSHGSEGGHAHHSHSHSHGGARGGDEGHAHSHDAEGGGDAPPPSASINLRGAWLHAAGDLLQSLGVAAAGAVVYCKPGWTLADPLVTLLFAVIVIATTRGIAGELLSILMEAAPGRVDLEALERELASVRGVAAVADLHVWALSAGVAVGTAHLAVLPGSSSSERRRVLAEARRAMEARGVAHSTIEVGEAEEGEGGGEGGV